MTFCYSRWMTWAVRRRRWSVIVAASRRSGSQTPGASCASGCWLITSGTVLAIRVSTFHCWALLGVGPHSFKCT